MLRRCILMIAFTSATGCATAPIPEDRTPQTGSHYTTFNPYQARPSLGTDPTNPPPGDKQIPPQRTTRSPTTHLTNLLYAQYREWRGTRYRLGGLSKAGIDCSGFVYVTYLDRLGIELPRSTYYQVQQGRPIARNQLRAGDLVFFRNGNSNHVGIYLEDGKFMHSSNTSGVRISSLDNTYWNRTYWTAKRLDTVADARLGSL